MIPKLLSHDLKICSNNKQNKLGQTEVHFRNMNTRLKVNSVQDREPTHFRFYRILDESDNQLIPYDMNLKKNKTESKFSPRLRANTFSFLHNF